MKYLLKLFEYQWKIQKLIMKVHKKYFKKINVINRFLFITCFISYIVCWSLKSEILLWLPLVISLLYILFDIFTNTIPMLTSISGFVKYSTFLLLFSFYILYKVLFTFAFNYISISESIKPYLTYFIICIALCLVWCIYSSFCNIDISTIINGILTAGIGVLIEFKSIIINIIPYKKIQNLLSLDDTILEMNGHNIRSMLDTIISLVLFPLLLTLSIATVICIIKKYWIKKYNCGMDINNELNIYNDVSAHQEN